MKTEIGKNQESQYSKSKGTATKEIKNINVKQTKCLICNKIYSNRSEMKRHVKSVHEAKKPHKCPICGYSCSKRSNLTRHVKSVHEGKKPHKCSICDYRCSIKPTLKVHVETVHEGKKPHKGSICDYSCSTLIQNAGSHSEIGFNI